MNEERARALTEKALSFASADHTEVSVGAGVQTAARFANNSIIQHVRNRDQGLGVTAAFGQRVGGASTNDLSDEGIRACVGRAEAAARSSEPNTEYLPPPGPQEYMSIDAWDDDVVELPHDTRATAISEALAPVEAAGLRAAGSYTTHANQRAIANSNGVFGYNRSTHACYVQTVLTENSSGWAESVGSALDQLDVPAASRMALQKAEAAKDPTEVKPGAYTVVFEPAAVAGLTSIVGWTMDAKTADEGRSCWTGLEGAQVGVPALTMRSVPAHPILPTSPWGEQGIAASDTIWIEDGVLRNLIYSRFWAQEKGREATGRPANLVIDGSDATTEDLIAQVDYGLLVTRFWYIRFVDPMKLLITGMTRDGLFLIEGGRVTRGVRNMRFNDSPLSVIKKIRAMGQARPTTLHGLQVVPPMLVDEFHFTSGTSF